jgi:hypothetical protein
VEVVGVEDAHPHGRMEFEGPGVPRFSVTLDDPGHAVKRIEVVLWREGESREPLPLGDDAGAADGDEDDDRVLIQNTPTLCPPTC